MDRGGTKHSHRLDDEMKRETEAIMRGSPVEPRAQEAREKEAAGEDQPRADVIDLTSGPSGTAPPPDEIEHRSELARFLLPSAFPATAAQLVAVSLEQNAPAWIVEGLERLPTSQSYENVQGVWEALGGHPETRATTNAPKDSNSREARRASTTL